MNFQKEHARGKFSLRDIRAVCRLECRRHRSAPYRARIYEEKLHVPVSADILGCADISANGDAPAPCRSLGHAGGKALAENGIHRIFEVAVARGGKAHFAVAYIAKGYLGMRECHFLHEGGDSYPLRYIGAQKFQSGRCSCE